MRDEWVRLLGGDGAREDADDSQAALRDAALAIDRARRLHRDQTPEQVLRFWEGLVAGRWSLVDHFDRDGRRYYVARRNDVAVLPARDLTPREREIAALAGLGHSNKRIAYELGLSPTTV